MVRLVFGSRDAVKAHLYAELLHDLLSARKSNHRKRGD